MSVLAQLFAAVVAVVHVLIFALESLLWRRPDVQRRFLVRTPADAEVVRPFLFNQGFYNLFLAIGIGLGLVLLHSGQSTVGRTLIVFGCASALAAALVLLATDRRMARAAAVQGGPAALALLSLLL